MGKTFIPEMSLMTYGPSPGSHSHDHFQVLWSLQGNLELEIEGKGVNLSAGTGIATAGSNIIPTLEASTGPYIIGTNTGDNQIIITTGGATLGTGTIYSLQMFYTID